MPLEQQIYQLLTEFNAVTDESGKETPFDKLHWRTKASLEHLVRLATELVQNATLKPAA